MKKSEKIEVRVSHEEKQRLSGIAETRGLSVSELIRDAVAEEIGTVPHVPRWPGYAAIAAGVLAAAALAVGLARPGTSAMLSERAPVITLYAHTGGASHETALSRSANAFEIANEGGRLIRVSATPGKTKDDITPVTFEVCDLVGDACERTENFELIAVTGGRAATRRFDFAGDELMVQVQTKSVRTEPPASS